MHSESPVDRTKGEKRKRRMPLLLVLMVRAVMVDYVSPGTATTKATDMNPYNYTTAAVQQQRHPQSNMTSRNPQDQTAGAVASTATEKPSNSDVTPAVPANVIFKLLGFTLAMVAAPISMYFLTVNSIFSGNSTFAGATAAVTANVVLFAYIFVAWQEDQGERAAEREKKAQ